MIDIIPAAHAQMSIESVGSQIGLGDADLRTVIINLLRLVLSFAPLVALSMIVVGGMLWLTSAGNEVCNTAKLYRA